MKKSLRERLFGPSDVRDSDAAALKKESALAKINEPDQGAKPRARRTVGLTEARLRAANQQSWMTSGKGWSDFLGRFIGNDRDLLTRLHAQTHLYRVAGSGSKFRIERNRIELPVGLTDGNAHYPTFLAEAVTGDSVNPTSVSSMM